MNKYIVRVEGASLLRDLFPNSDVSTILGAYGAFKLGFLKLISDVLPQVTIKTYDLDSQLNKARIDLYNKDIISLDSLYKCDNNIRTSRVFEFGSDMKSFKRIDSSYKGLTLQEQIDKIPSGVYTLVDDDSVASGTIMSIIESLSDGEYLQDKIKENKYCYKNSMMALISMLPKRIIINDVYLLAESEKDVLDTVDLRDFIFGLSNAGLKVEKDGVVARVPYISNFVNLTSRASIPESDILSFSNKICELNYNLFSSIDKTLKLSGLSEDFQQAMSWLGVESSCFVTDICKFLRR